MARFQFTPVAKSHEADFAKIAKPVDPSVAKTHDTKVYAALTKPFKEVSDYYAAYEKLVLEAKKQCKSNIDAMENTLKVCAGKPTAVQLRLLGQSRGLIQGFAVTLKDHAQEIKTEMLDWRGPWDEAIKKVVFNTAALDLMKAYRKTLIDNQTGTWNPITERVEQYALRADMLYKAIEKSAENSQRNFAQAFKEATSAHKACMTAGTKAVKDVIETVDSDRRRFSDQAKAGIAKGEDVQKVWAAKKGKMEQFAGYRKTFKGAEKTLNMIFESVESEIKDAKLLTEIQQWQDLRFNLQADMSFVAAALRNHTEAMKSVNTITKQYEDAIKKLK